MKWIGGKHRLVAKLEDLLPADFRQRRYVEPFVGGGALFFHLAPKRALLADTNEHLITTYIQVRDDLPNVIKHLERHSRLHNKSHYYTVRDRFNAGQGSAAERAAMVLYMNRVCFNGVWRVNKAGAFNVPMGDYKKPQICDEPRLQACADALAGKQLLVSDFLTLGKSIRPKDFVYFDPPYMPLNADSFRSYSSSGFHLDDQVALRDLFADLDARGAKLMLSNSDTPATRDLYARWRVTTVSTPRSVSQDASKRGTVTELVVRNY